MAIDTTIISDIHKFLTDREIFDTETLWLAASIFTTVAPVSLTEKLPNWLMTGLNAITMHFSNSKQTDIKGNRKS